MAEPAFQDNDHRCTVLRLIPPPAQPLTPDAARQWLAGWAPEYLTVLAFAFGLEDAEARDAYGMLATDVRELLEACTDAIESDRPVTVESEDLWHEGAEIRGELARIIVHRDTSSVGAFEAVYDVLGRRLAELLLEAEEGAS